MSQYIAFPAGSIAPGTYVQTLTSNSGGAVPSDAMGNINIVGDGTILSGVGVPGANTITFNLVGIVPVANGGTSRSTLTSHGLIYGLGTSAVGMLSEASNGQIPIGSTGNAPVLGTITAGANITVTNASGAITIAANAGSSTLNYTPVNHAASPYTVLTTDDYISVDVTAGVVSILLPNAPTLGRIFAIKDKVGMAATNNITVTTVGGAINIDGATSFVMNTAYESIQLIWNASSYEIY